MKSRTFLRSLTAGLFALPLFSPLSAQDPSLEKTAAWAKEKISEMPAIGELPSGMDLYESTEPSTPKQLKALGKEMREKGKRGEWTAEAKALIEMIQNTPRKEQFDGDEAEFHPEIRDDPKAAIRAVSVENDPGGEEAILKTCEESGDYGRVFHQRRIVKASSSSRKKTCLGHTRAFLEEVSDKDKKRLKKKARQRKRELQQQFEADSTVQKGFFVFHEKHKYHCDLFADFQHVDDAASCTRFAWTQVPCEDAWETDDPQQYAEIVNNPQCRPVFIKTVEGEGTHQIDGQEIFRDVWAQDISFACGPSDASPCAPLRLQGGVLVKKRCLRANAETSECELWEKIFDLGKRRGPQKKYTFAPGQEIWGLNGEFDTASAKDHNLPKILSIFSSLSDLPQGEGKRLLGMDEKTQIFNGSPHQCSKNHNIHELYDCCKMTGLIQERCDNGERELVRLMQEERCHYVGHRQEGIFPNRKTTRVFCCFPTKLLRKFNEQAREQMGIGWGTAEQPECRGFSLEEMGDRVDLSAWDAAEAAEDFPIDEAAVMREMQQKIRDSLADPHAKNRFQELFDVPPPQ